MYMASFQGLVKCLCIWGQEGHNVARKGHILKYFTHTNFFLVHHKRQAKAGNEITLKYLCAWHVLNACAAEQLSAEQSISYNIQRTYNIKALKSRHFASTLHIHNQIAS